LQLQREWRALRSRAQRALALLAAARVPVTGETAPAAPRVQETAVPFRFPARARLPKLGSQACASAAGRPAVPARVVPTPVPAPGELRQRRHPETRPPVPRC